MRTFTGLFLLATLQFSSTINAQYCMLPGRTPYINIQPGITNFKLNTINRTSLAVENISAVVVETGDTTTLLRGHTYTVTMTHSRDTINFPTVRNNIRVWIDYNQNFSFDDAGETAITADFQTYGVYTNTFTVPTTATIGITRLRATAKMSSDGGHTLPTSCDTPMDPIGYHGEMEDYVVKIQAPTAIEEVGAHIFNVAAYPNPTMGHITIAFDEILSIPVSIEMYDVTGKLVATLCSNQSQSSPLSDYDLSNYAIAPGVYIVKVSSGESASYLKVIKAN